MQKLLILSLFILGSQFVMAQNDDNQDIPAPVNPLEEMLQQFDLDMLGGGNGIFMDTTIIKQFGDLGFTDADLQESMQEMMKMFEQQFKDLDLGNMQDLNQLFEGFGMDSFPQQVDPNAPTVPGQEQENSQKKTVKKRKSYKL